MRTSPRFNEAAANCCGILFHCLKMGCHHSGFNEAAANCCGIRGRSPNLLPEDVASMRPQQIAAEYANALILPALAKSGFNEAAANCCGIPEKNSRYWLLSLGFNEAAANCCGIPR